MSTMTTPEVMLLPPDANHQRKGIRLSRLAPLILMVSPAILWLLLFVVAPLV